jgi:hypothetical protein
MRNLLVVCLLVGCQPLYSGKPAKMRNPDETRPKTGEPVAEEIVWDDKCNSEFFGKPSALKPNAGVVQKHVATGDLSLDASEREAPTAKKSSLVLAAIDEYKLALVEDPYSAEATYGLAVAYATVYKKQCALDLINRLVALRSYPRSEPDAKRLLTAAYSEPAFKPFKSALP